MQPVVVGLLRNPRVVASLTQGRNIDYLSLHIDAAKSAGVDAYFFSPDDVDLSSKEIRGWVRISRGAWQYTNVPWPDVVYDRGLQFEESEKTQARDIRKLLRQGSRFINSVNVLDKWITYDIATLDSRTAGLVPETTCYKTIEDLKEMMDRYPQVLVKPFVASSGEGISRLSSCGSGRFLWEDPVTGKRLENLTVEEASMAIYRHMNGKRFIVQQQVKLLNISNQRFDIRVLMAKDGQGKWNSVRDHAWLFKAGTNRNWIRGVDSDAFPLSEMIHRIVPAERVSKLLTKIQQSSLRLVQNTEVEVGPMGEIGLDFGLDQDFKLWFFEANTMPEKEPEPCDNVSGIPWSYVTVMEYAKFLAKQVRQ